MPTIGKALAAASLVAASLVTAPAIAAEGDMLVGTFGTRFCGARATFEVYTQGDDWVFDGRILIHSTGEYDQLKIKQYSNNHLRIIRYLTGANEGATQWVDTSPPKFYQKDGRTVASFHSARGAGVGCNNDGAVTDLRVTY